MYEQVEKPKENKSRTVANSVAQKKSNGKQGFGFVDNRPEAIAPRKLNRIVDNLSNSKHIKTKVGGESSVVQRDVENATYTDIDSTNNAMSELFFNSYNTAVQKAYEFAIAVPSLGAYENLNGYTKLWIKKWHEFLRGERPKLMAATFGYVVESLVSHENSDFHPNPPSGYSVDNQVVSGGTRPDLVLRLARGSQHIAWLDLTAAASADHIFNKDNWSRKVKNFAEVTYPSISPATMGLMVLNKDNTGALSKEEFAKRLEAANKIYEKRKESWIRLGKGFQKKTLGRKIPESREEQELNPSIARKYILVQLTNHFSPAETLNEKMVPSILAALQVNSTSWGYQSGFSASEKAGEAWLVDNDPSLE